MIVLIFLIYTFILEQIDIPLIYLKTDLIDMVNHSLTNY